MSHWNSAGDGTNEARCVVLDGGDAFCHMRTGGWIGWGIKGGI